MKQSFAVSMFKEEFPSYTLHRSNNRTVGKWENRAVSGGKVLRECTEDFFAKKIIVALAIEASFLFFFECGCKGRHCPKLRTREPANAPSKMKDNGFHPMTSVRGCRARNVRRGSDHEQRSATEQEVAARHSGK